jgi:hypothetical protein
MALLTTIILGYKGLPESDTPANNNSLLFAGVKSFIPSALAIVTRLKPFT